MQHYFPVLTLEGLLAEGEAHELLLPTDEDRRNGHHVVSHPPLYPLGGEGIPSTSSPYLDATSATSLLAPGQWGQTGEKYTSILTIRNQNTALTQDVKRFIDF